MVAPGQALTLEEQIDQWRNYLRSRQAFHAVDVAELEDHLRDQVDGLIEAGLASDEAFLVAVKRMGDLDELSREYALEHSDRLWKQLVAPDRTGSTGRIAPMDAIVAFALAIVAAMLFKLPALFGLNLDDDAAFYARNLSFLVLPLLTGYFVWRRETGFAVLRWLAIPFVAGAAVVNLYPFEPDGFTGILAALHLPVALWLVVGIAYAGKRWSQVAGRMDFIRFSGELFIYYTLIALGGGVLTAFTALIFQVIGVDVETFISHWLLPCGALGAVLVASWLVETKQSVIENMAPVLTRLFSPLFALMLIAFLVTLILTGSGVDADRDALIAFDMLLLLVLGLLLYSISARDPLARPGIFDYMQVVLVVSALLANGVALWAIVTRISEFGFSPNRVAGLGINALLIVNLAVSTVLYIRFVRGRGTFARLERWQTDYLPVYAFWAAFVVVVFPLIFWFD